MVWDHSGARENQSLTVVSGRIWLLMQLGVFVLPIIPSLGTILIFIVTVTIGIKHKKFLAKSRLNQILGILSLWLIFTCFFAPYPGEAFLGLANYLPFFLAFSAIHFLFNHPIQLRQIAWLIVIPSLVVAILGLGQLFLNWHFFDFFGWELVAGGKPQGRMSSVFIYANFLAFYLQIVLIFALGLWFEFLPYLRPKKSMLRTIIHHKFPFILSPIIKQIFFFNRRKKSLVSRVNFSQILIFIFLSITLFFDGISLILTSSRNSWVISFIAVICFFLYLGCHKLILALNTLILSIIWSSIGPDPVKTSLRNIIPQFIWERLADEKYPDRPIETLRITQWQFTIDLIKEHPVMGTGLRNFTPLYEEKWHLWLGHPHNLYLMFTSETGLIGIILLGSFIALILYYNLKLLREITKKNQAHLIIFTYIIAFGSCMLFNLFDVSLFDLRVNILTWTLLFALAGTIKHKVV